jgi:hypothetical protein
MSSSKEFLINLNIFIFKVCFNSLRLVKYPHISSKKNKNQSDFNEIENRKLRETVKILLQSN